MRRSCEKRKELKADQTFSKMMEEETISLILRGCNLATHLELNIPNLANQPNLLLKSCDDIIKIFSSATERIRSQNPNPSPSPSPYPQPVPMIDVNFPEWVRSSPSSQLQAMDIRGLIQAAYKERGVIRLQETGSGQVAGVGGREVHNMPDVSISGKSVLPPQTSRGRKDDMEKRTMRVAAPIMGNTEIPPDDGFTWRKYGQKEILGSKFPRAYYRCTHQKLYQCSAKKQVQRLDEDPFTFQVTYRGEHSCHKSATAPSVSPLRPFPVPHQPTSQALPSHFPPAWLSVELSSGSGSTSSMAGSGEGPSTVRFGRETEFLPVADIADAMFNPGPSTGDDMEFIFPSAERKWEPGDGKNR